MSLVVHHRKLTNYVAFTTITENVYYDSHYDVWIEICQEFRIVGSCFCFFIFSLVLSHFPVVRYSNFAKCLLLIYARSVSNVYLLFDILMINKRL